MDLQFYHGTKHKQYFKEFTVCVDVPSKLLLLSHLNDVIMGRDNCVPIPVGFSVLNPIDQYDKREGRKLSLSRTSTKSFEILSIQQDKENDRVIVELVHTDLKIVLEIKNGRERVYFVSSVVYS